MMCLCQEIALLVISEMRLKTGVCGNTVLFEEIRSEVDPFGGVEKRPKRIRYEINKFVL